MNTKYFILLTAALTTFTAQCMNENNQLALLTNDKKQLSVQELKNNRDELINKIIKQKITYQDHNYNLITSPAPPWLYLSVAYYPTKETLYISQDTLNSILPLIQWDQAHFTTVYGLKNIRLNNYSALGIITIAHETTDAQKKELIKKMLTASYKPTAQDKEFALLDQYERCEKYIQNIMLLTWFIHDNILLFPRDIIKHIALTVFNLEEPLF
jgi:hypothetical protein